MYHMIIFTRSILIAMCNNYEDTIKKRIDDLRLILHSYTNESTDLSSDSILKLSEKLDKLIYDFYILQKKVK